VYVEVLVRLGVGHAGENPQNGVAHCGKQAHPLERKLALEGVQRVKQTYPVVAVLRWGI